jgi:tetratricopeptide (TPR) repeat protein
MKTIAWLLMMMALPASTAAAQDRYRHYMDLCEQSKQAGDFAKMEEAIQQALRNGPGDEYAWRSLAWAQARQGKWKDSLENARKNIQRNGKTGWSVAQYADSALGCGEFALARKALDFADKLPPATLAGCEGELKSCAVRLLAATCARTYELRFKMDLKQGGPGRPAIWMLMPQKETPWQTFTFTVRNAVSYRDRHVGIRDYIEVVQKPDEPFFVEGKLILKPFCLGVKRLEEVPEIGRAHV